MEKKAELDNRKKEQQKVVDDTELAMRTKAGSVGNIIHKDVPVSNDEVCWFCYTLSRR
jgi:seryl-tRNA synthetase